jgi:hypothetical protein
LTHLRLARAELSQHRFPQQNHTISTTQIRATRSRGVRINSDPNRLRIQPHLYEMLPVISLTIIRQSHLHTTFSPFGATQIDGSGASPGRLSIEGPGAAAKKHCNE